MLLFKHNKFLCFEPKNNKTTRKYLTLLEKGFRCNLCLLRRMNLLRTGIVWVSINTSLRPKVEKEGFSVNIYALQLHPYIPGTHTYVCIQLNKYFEVYFVVSCKSMLQHVYKFRIKVVCLFQHKHKKTLRQLSLVFKYMQRFENLKHFRFQISKILRKKYF